MQIIDFRIFLTSKAFPKLIQSLDHDQLVSAHPSLKIPLIATDKKKRFPLDGVEDPWHILDFSGK